MGRGSKCFTFRSPEFVFVCFLCIAVRRDTGAKISTNASRKGHRFPAQFLRTLVSLAQVFPHGKTHVLCCMFVCRLEWKMYVHNSTRSFILISSCRCPAVPIRIVFVDAPSSHTICKETDSEGHPRTVFARDGAFGGWLHSRE